MPRANFVRDACKRGSLVLFKGGESQKKTQIIRRRRRSSRIHFLRLPPPAVSFGRRIQTHLSEKPGPGEKKAWLPRLGICPHARACSSAHSCARSSHQRHPQLGEAALHQADRGQVEEGRSE